MKKNITKTLALIAAAFILPMAAQADSKAILTEVPKHRYTFDTWTTDVTSGFGDYIKHSTGATALTVTKTVAGKIRLSPRGGALWGDSSVSSKGEGPYGSGLALGSGDWTYYTRVKAINLKDGVLFCVGGNSSTSTALSLLQNEDKGVSLVTTKGKALVEGSRTDIAVTDAVGKYHDYAIVFDATEKIAYLYVDGALGGSLAHPNYDTSNTYWQWGSIYGGLGTTGYQFGADCDFEEFRFYQRKLTTEELAYLRDYTVKPAGFQFGDDRAFELPSNQTLYLDATGKTLKGGDVVFTATGGITLNGPVEIVGGAASGTVKRSDDGKSLIYVTGKKTVARWDFNNYDSSAKTSADILQATVGGNGSPCHYPGSGSTNITDGTIGGMYVVAPDYEGSDLEVATAAASLGEGNYAIAVPKYYHVKLPLPEEVKNKPWTVNIRFYAPNASKGKYRCMLNREGNTEDGNLFIDKNNKMGKFDGKGSYTAAVSIPGWHTVTVSQRNMQREMTLDGTIIATWANNDKMAYFDTHENVLLCADQSGEDELLYIDYIELQVERAAAEWTGAKDNNAEDPANWTVYDEKGGVVPGAVPYNTLPCNVKLTNDADWTGLVRQPILNGMQIDLNGHSLKVNRLEGSGLVTDSSADTTNPGELHWFISEGETLENTTIQLSGNLKFVKEGAGTFVSKLKNQLYTGGTVISNGVIKAADSEKYYYLGATDTDITVEPNGTLELNGKYDWVVHRIVLNGGILQNTGGNMTSTTYGGLGDILLTADSQMKCKYHTLFNDGSATRYVDLGGHTLKIVQIENPDDNKAMMYFNHTTITNGTVEVGTRILFYPMITTALGSGASVVNNGDFRFNAADITLVDFTDASQNINQTRGKRVYVTGRYTPKSEYLLNVTLKNGATLDLTNETSAWTFGNKAATQTMTYEEGTITVDIHGRELAKGAQVVAWTAIPKGVTFQWDEETRGKAGCPEVSVTDNGIFYGQEIVSATWKGGASGDVTDPANWACTNAQGTAVSGVLPGESTVVTMTAPTMPTITTDMLCGSVALSGMMDHDVDWRGFSDVRFADGSTLDLNGHAFTVGNLDVFDGTMTITDSATTKGRIALAAGVTKLSANLSIASDITVRIGGDATLDTNGKSGKFKVLMADGATLTNTGDGKGYSVEQLSGGITLEAGAKVYVSPKNEMSFTNKNYAKYSVNMNGGTIVKTNTGKWGVVNVEFTGGGKVVVEKGEFNIGRKGFTCGESFVIELKKDSTSYIWVQGACTVPTILGDGNIASSSNKLTVNNRFSGLIKLGKPNGDNPFSASNKLTLGNGATLDLSGNTAAYAMHNNFAFGANNNVIDIHGREFAKGEQVVAWNVSGAPGTAFTWDATYVQQPVVAADGLFYGLNITTAYWTGAEDGDVTKAANWACTNVTGHGISGALPTSDSTVYFRGDNIQAQIANTVTWAGVDVNGALGANCDWTGLGTTPIVDNSSIDVNGHNLTLTKVFKGTVTDTTEGTPGSLTLNVAQGATLENETMVLSGNLKLIKGGEGTFISRLKNQNYAGGTVVNAGTIKSVGYEVYFYYGADATPFTINAGGILDINGQYSWYRHHIYLSGGEIRNSNGDQIDYNSKSALGNITLTADSTMLLKHHTLVNYTDTSIDLGGHTLTVTHDSGTSDALLTFNHTKVFNGTIDLGQGIRFYPYGSTPDFTDATVVMRGSCRLTGDQVFSNLVSNLNKADSQYTADKKITVKGAFKPVSKYLHNTLLANGATLDLTDKTEPFDVNGSLIANQTVTFAEGTITVDIQGRNLNLTRGEQVVAWTAIPEGVTFKWDPETLAVAHEDLTVKESGIYYGMNVAKAYWTNKRGDGDVTKAENWACTNSVGQGISGVVPTSDSTVYFRGDNIQAQIASAPEWKEVSINGKLGADCNWTALGATPITEGSTIDVNGHNLTLTKVFKGTVTDGTTSGESGSLTLNVAENAALTNTTLVLTGKLKLVKDGAGTFVGKVKSQSYTGGTVISNGVIEAADYEKSYYLGAKGTDITVESEGTLDLNGWYDWAGHRIVLAGGTLQNTGSSMTETKWGGLGDVVLTADSKMKLKYHTLFNDNDATRYVDLGGHTLTVDFIDNPDDPKAIIYVRNNTFTNGTLVLNSHIVLRHLTDCAGENFALVVNGDISPNSSTLTIESLTDNSEGLVTDGNKLITVTKYFKPVSTKLHNTQLADGATLDLNGKTATWSTASALSGQSVTFADNATITVDLSERTPQLGDKIIEWAAQPTGVAFQWDSKTASQPAVQGLSGLYYGEIGPTPAKDVLLTWPWQQNVYTNRFTIMCETSKIANGLTLQYGEGYAESVTMTYVAGRKSGTYIYKGVVSKEEGVGTEVPYRLAIDGVPLKYAAAGESTEGVVKLWQDGDGDFTCSVWSDNQGGAKAGDWDADIYRHATCIFEHMKARNVDFGITAGDFATTCNYDTQVKPLILDRTDAIFGRTIPYYVTFGNHDVGESGGNVKTMDYFDTGDQTTTGKYYLYRNNVLFVFVHYKGTTAETATWLANLLATDRAKAAKFRILVQHAPFWLECWGKGNNNDTLLEAAKAGGIDLVLSGHMHGYERIERDGIVQITNGGMGALDHTQSVTVNYGSDTKVGGHLNTPYLWARQASEGVLGGGNPVRMGCITSYGELSVKGDTLTYQAHGFNADGSYIGVFDTMTLGAKVAPSQKYCEDSSAYAQFTEKPVDNAAWKTYKDAIGEPFEYPAGEGAKPVVSASRTEIEAFCTWLNGPEGKSGSYRLPVVSELAAAFGGEYAREVTEWTMSVDEATGWCRILGGNAKAAEGVWTSASDTPMIATSDCRANYLGFRLAEGALPVEPTMEVVGRWDFNNYDSEHPKSTNVLVATKGGHAGPCYYKGAGTADINDLGDMYVTNVVGEAGNYAIAIPKSYHVKLPIPKEVKGKVWKMTIRFFTPASSDKLFRCFFNRDNTTDGDLFINTSNKIGGGQIDPSRTYPGDAVAAEAWHELVIEQGESSGSMAVDGTVTLSWSDTSRLGFFAGYDYLLLCADDDGDDNLLFIDYVEIEGLVTPERETATWTGAAGDNNVRNGQNWEGGVAPIQYGAFTHNIRLTAAADWSDETAVPLADYAIVDLGGQTLKLPNFNQFAKAEIVDTAEGTKGTLCIGDGMVKILSSTTIPAGVTLTLGGTATLDLNGVNGTLFRLVMEDGATLCNSGAVIDTDKVPVIGGGLALAEGATGTVNCASRIQLRATNNATYPLALNGGTLVKAGQKVGIINGAVTGPGTIRVTNNEFNIGGSGIAIADDVVIYIEKDGPYTWTQGHSTVPTIMGDGKVGGSTYYYTITKRFSGLLTVEGKGTKFADGMTLDLSQNTGVYTIPSKVTVNDGAVIFVDLGERTGWKADDKIIAWSTQPNALFKVGPAELGLGIESRSDGLYVKFNDGIPTADTSGKGSVEVPMSWANDYVATAGKTTEEISAELVKPRTEGNKITLRDCYVLGLDPEEPTSVPYMAPAQVSDEGKITLTVKGLDVKAESGALVKYQMMTKTTGSYVESGDPAYVPTLETDLPASGVKYYKVDVIVTTPEAEKEPKPPQVTINGKGYPSLAAAIGDAAAGDTLVVLGDLETGADVNVAKDMTIDMNELTIAGTLNVKSGATLTVCGVGEFDGPITVEDGGKLDFKNGKHVEEV